MDSTVEDCPVCMNTFDDTLNRPLIMPCGHTVCSQCINGLKEQGAIKCPTCRVSHSVPEGGQFPICYAFERLVRSMRCAELESLPPKLGEQSAAVPLTQPELKTTTELSKRAQSQLQEQEAKVLTAICSCQEEQSQLADYLTTLGGWGDRQQKLEDELVDQSKNALEAVRHEESRVKVRQEETRQMEQQLQVVLEALRTVETRQKAYEVIEDADHLVEEESQKTEKCLRVFPDAHVVTTVARVAKASRAALEVAAAVAGTAPAAAGDPNLPPALAAASSIDDRVQALLVPPPKAKDLPPQPLQTKGLSPLPLKAEDLLSLSKAARGLVQAGLVFAVHNVEGKHLYARISLENDRLHLYSLQAQDPPRRAVILQMADVVPAVPPCEVFMNLNFCRRSLGRIVVSVPRDTPKGRQFLSLCSGQQGTCYVGTNLLEVECKEDQGERVWGGFKGCDRKARTTSLLSHLDHGEYWESDKAGAVGWCWWDNQGTEFAITTRDWRNGGVWPGVFGNVVQGLNVVKDAASYRPIKDVTVVQCGVVLGLLPRSQEKEGTMMASGESQPPNMA